MKANARFWVWHRGGWVKLTLRPGESRETVARAVGSDDPAGPTVRPAMVAKYQARYPQEDLREWSETASVVRIEWPM